MSQNKLINPSAYVYSNGGQSGGVHPFPYTAFLRELTASSKSGGAKNRKKKAVGKFEHGS
jgi:hypothetical protein